MLARMASSSSLPIAIEGNVLLPGYFHGQLQTPWVHLRIHASQGLVINDLCLEQDPSEGILHIQHQWPGKLAGEEICGSNDQLIQDCRQENHHLGALFSGRSLRRLRRMDNLRQDLKDVSRITQELLKCHFVWPLRKEKDPRLMQKVSPVQETVVIVSAYVFFFTTEAPVDQC